MKQSEQLAPIGMVIPVYNRAHTLPRTLDSIAAQTVMPSQIIIVDNGSTDSSKSVVSDRIAAFRQKHPEVIVKLIDESKPGACAARNRGLQEIAAPFTMFFDSDDIMFPSHVADFAKAIAENPGIEIFGRDMWLEAPDGSRRRLYCHLTGGHRTTLFHHIFRASLSTQRIVASTRLYREAGGWDEDLDGWNDFEIGVRLILARPKMMSLGGDPTVVGLSQAESITGTSFSAHPQRWEKSLWKIRQILEKSDFAPEAVRWVDGRAMVLAAQYDSESPEGSSPLSESLRSRVEALTDSPRRLRMIYRHQRRFGRLSWVVARILL
ncbi:MAG: glycosyltransferase family 2 protein [Duncaniella sp.]|nr:glycosyltransferase family 2 protein [Duncaniella sp.]